MHQGVDNPLETTPAHHARPSVGGSASATQIARSSAGATSLWRPRLRDHNGGSARAYLSALSRRQRSTVMGRPRHDGGRARISIRAMLYRERSHMPLRAHIAQGKVIVGAAITEVMSKPSFPAAFLRLPPIRRPRSAGSAIAFEAPPAVDLQNARDARSVLFAARHHVGDQIRPSMRSTSSPSGSRHSVSPARAISSTDAAASNASSVAAAMPRKRSGSSSLAYCALRCCRHARTDDFTTFPVNRRG
jgi:hypothetical protein